MPAPEQAYRTSLFGRFFFCPCCPHCPLHKIPLNVHGHKDFIYADNMDSVDKADCRV